MCSHAYDGQKAALAAVPSGAVHFVFILWDRVSLALVSPQRLGRDLTVSASSVYHPSQLFSLGFWRLNSCSSTHDAGTWLTGPSPQH